MNCQNDDGIKITNNSYPKNSSEASLHPSIAVSRGGKESCEAGDGAPKHGGMFLKLTPWRQKFIVKPEGVG